MTSAVSQTKTVGLLSQWFGVGAGPVLWSARLAISYAMVGVGCNIGFTQPEVLGLSGIEIPVALVSLVAVLITLAALGVSWRNWWRLRNGNEEPGSRSRSRFMAVSGMVLSILFAAVMMMETAPIFVLVPCARL